MELFNQKQIGLNNKINIKIPTIFSLNKIKKNNNKNKINKKNLQFTNQKIQ